MNRKNLLWKQKGVRFRVVNYLCVILFAFSLISEKAQATHAAGADLTYQCLGGLVYQIEAAFYRDCGGSFEPGNVTISYKSASCGYARSVLATKVLVNNGTEITLPCASSATTCNGGMATGLRKWVYRAVVTLPAACSDWVFSYRVCCRNCTITTIQSPCAVNSEIYVEANLNNLVAPCNSSPVFNNMPIAFVCLGQNFNYNQGVYDADGDSLSYELITPKISATGEVTWLAPATTTSPLASSTPFLLNPVTGDINFTPSGLQIGILAVRVNEYRNGILIGNTIRDMQVYTQNCYNSIPVATGINGTGNYITSVCAGQQLCFTISALDVDSTQVVTFSTYNPISGSVITQSGGNLPSLQFCWTPTVANISRQPHIFTVTIHDDACPVNGVQTFSYAIFVNGPVATVTAVNPSCSGNSNGTATASVFSQSSCTFNWNTTPVQTTPTASGLDAGTYEVVITDSLGCSTTASVTLNSPANTLSVSGTVSGIISCQSAGSASIQAVASGGTLPYSFLWNTGATTSGINGIGAGSYTVTVTDVIGCMALDTMVILSPQGTLILTPLVNNPVSCYGGNNGAATVNVSGGTGPYSYSWSNGGTTAAISNLQSGNYTVTVEDGNGCTASASVNINEPSSPVLGNIVCSNVTCFGAANGALNLFVSGGMAPYSFTWNTGATTEDLSALTAGNYSVTISDANGCTSTQSITVPQPASVLNTTLVSAQNVSCFGGDDGSAVVAASGGTAPYSYSWSHGATASSVNNLEAGTYEVTITDANGCSVSSSLNIFQPAAPLLSLTTIISQVSCFNDSNGVVDLTVNGGTLPYTYQWSNGSIDEDISNLSAGAYHVVITDGNGCTTTATATIVQPSQALSSTIDIQHVLCFNGTNGSATISASGGTAPYEFQWSNGSELPVISGLNAGTYMITVTDGNGCTATSTVTITQPAAPLIPVVTIAQPVLCSGLNTGSFMLQVTGGTSPYTFLWSNGVTIPNNSNLGSGTYTVTVTDVNGCNAIISTVLDAPASAIAVQAISQQPVSCFGGNNGSLEINASGGTAPYSYLWSNGALLPHLNGLIAGNYTVTVTDSLGCSASSSFTVNQPPAALSVSGNATAANCLSGNGGSVSLTVTGGDPGYSYLWNNGFNGPSPENLVPGNYSVVVTDMHGCTANANFVIENNVSFSISAIGPTTICVGETATLVADSVATGNYQWFFDGSPLNGDNGIQFITPAAGYYTVSITNNCGTFYSDSVEIIVKSIGNVSVSNTQIICPPETAQLQATGGVTYDWSPASYITFTNVPDPVVSPLTNTLYSVVISNEHGCKTTLSTQVAVICDSLLVPTGFSPNDDGTNDGYVIDGIENYPGNKLWVYNRWGKLVYKARDYANSWDGVGNVSGVYMGKKVPTGTYYYILDLNDQSKPRAGYLIIRR